MRSFYILVKDHRLLTENEIYCLMNKIEFDTDYVYDPENHFRMIMEIEYTDEQRELVRNIPSIVRERNVYR